MIFVGQTTRLTVILISIWGLTLAGCATMQTSQTESTEQLLSAAGFHLKLANTPKRQAHLQTLVQRQLVPYAWKGKTVYVYADAAKDQLYVGDEAAYQRFQQLAVEKQIAHEQAMAASYNAEAAMNWDMWGPYPWWY